MNILFSFETCGAKQIMKRINEFMSEMYLLQLPRRVASFLPSFSIQSSIRSRMASLHFSQFTAERALAAHCVNGEMSEVDCGKVANHSISILFSFSTRFTRSRKEWMECILLIKPFKLKKRRKHNASYNPLSLIEMNSFLQSISPFHCEINCFYFIHFQINPH